MRNTFLMEKVSFALSVGLIGSAALLGIVMILEADDKTNPIAQMMADTVYAEDIDR